jgi:nitrogen fixation/metabolism regulation signal transduction histidine kinase
MGFKNFRLVVTGRILLISLTLFLLFYLGQQTSLYATAAVVALLLIVQIYSLIKYIERTNNDLVRFLSSIRYSDFTQSFSARGRGRSFGELSAAISEVMNDFRRVRMEKEEQFQYLQTVVQHIGVGLVVFRQDGEVELVNTAAKRLLNVNHLTNIKGLSAVNPALVDTLFAMSPGRKVLFKLDNQSEITQLAIHATSFRLREQYTTLVSLQNIRTELEEKEMEAWQKLIRVLTHEIMNTITPITSLAATADDLLKPGEGEPTLSLEVLTDVRSAIRTIKKRSQGLLHFVDAYRNLTRVPRPNFKICGISDLFAQAEQLMKTQMPPQRAVRFHSRVDPESLELTADPELVEQVLINLLLNALHGVQDQANGEIAMEARLDERGRVIVEVIDNGAGISEEAREKIFVPFFTTKQEGSGIGLSLSKEIMRLHKGSIEFQSEPGKQTVFRLTF